MGRPDAEQRPLTHDGEHEQSGTKKQDAAVTNLRYRDVGEQRPSERPRRAPGRDQPEQTFRLLAAEQFQQEAPEYRDREQVENADEDPEKLVQPQAWSAAAKREADDRQRYRDGRIRPWQEYAPAKPGHEPAVNGDDEERRGRGANPEVGKSIGPDQRADRVADGPDGEIAGHDAEEQQERGDDRGHLPALDGAQGRH